MAFSRISQHIDGLKQDIYAYVNAKIEYLELKMIKVVTETSAKIVKGVMAAFFFVMFLGMVSMAVAIFVGQLLGDLSYGFFIVAGFYLLLMLLVLLFAKRVLQRKILKALSKVMMQRKANKKS